MRSFDTVATRNADCTRVDTEKENSFASSRSANQFLTFAAEKMKERAAQRDVEQERSMSKIVAIFNIACGKDLTETEGWQFMEILKLVRGNTGPYNEDDWIDKVAYAALAAESASRSESHK